MLIKAHLSRSTVAQHSRALTAAVAVAGPGTGQLARCSVLYSALYCANCMYSSPPPRAAAAGPFKRQVAFANRHICMSPQRFIAVAECFCCCGCCCCRRCSVFMQCERLGWPPTERLRVYALSRARAQPNPISIVYCVRTHTCSSIRAISFVMGAAGWATTLRHRFN